MRNRTPPRTLRYRNTHTPPSCITIMLAVWKTSVLRCLMVSTEARLLLLLLGLICIPWR